MNSTRSKAPFYFGIVAALAAAGLWAPETPAQFFDHLRNPTVAVTLNHPPGLGLVVKKIAFGPSQGKCSDQIVDELVGSLVSAGLEVIDRQHLDSILAEQDLGLSGIVDKASAAEIGKILGPSALLFVRTQRCSTETKRLYDVEKRYDRERGEYTVTNYHSRTRAFLNASIQTVDLATGRIFAARALQFSPEKTNSSYEGYPEPPSEYDMMNLAIRAAVTEVYRMFLPWTEQRQLIFYDDKDCDLKSAFALLKAGDTKGTLERSLENLEACQANPKAKDKLLAHANYNVGMGHLMNGDHDQALVYFREAAKLRPGDIVSKAIADCQRAKELSAEMLRVEERAAFVADREQAEQDAAARAQEDAAREKAASALTNEDVIKMVKAALSESIIIHRIKNSECRFDTSTDGLKRLKEAGVGDSVILAMLGP